jgi:hypothetical protein
VVVARLREARLRCRGSGATTGGGATGVAMVREDNSTVAARERGGGTGGRWRRGGEAEVREDNGGAVEDE